MNGGSFLVNPSKTISFGAENANFFYQEEPYITGNKMYYIDTQFLSSLSARFLESILNTTFSNNFSFSDGMIPSRIKDEKIKLPARKNEQGKLEPDWPYMETYIKNVQQKANARLDNLQNKIKTHKTA